MRSRAIASSFSHIVLDPNGSSVLFSTMAVFSFRAGIVPVVLGDQKITPPSVHLHTL
jgi:hypothetical protein